MPEAVPTGSANTEPGRLARTVATASLTGAGAGGLLAARRNGACLQHLVLPMESCPISKILRLSWKLSNRHCRMTIMALPAFANWRAALASMPNVPPPGTSSHSAQINLFSAYRLTADHA